MSLETLATIISIVTFAGGVLAWYSGAVQKRYAAQRDFEHLKRNYEQLARNQETILKEIDSKFDVVARDLLELKSLTNQLFIRCASDQNSIGWRRSDDQR